MERTSIFDRIIQAIGSAVEVCITLLSCKPVSSKVLKTVSRTKLAGAIVSSSSKAGSGPVQPIFCVQFVTSAMIYTSREIFDSVHSPM